MKYYNICIIGTSEISDIAVTTFKKLNCNIHSVVGSSIEKAYIFSKKHSINNYYENIVHVLTKEIDIVYIAVPNKLHYRFARYFLTNEVHVILEKPFCLNIDDATNLFVLAESKKVFIFEAYYTKYLPSFDTLLNSLNKIGKIKFISLNAMKRSRSLVSNSYRGNKKFDIDLGNSSFMNIGIYGIHFISLLFSVKFETIVGKSNNSINEFDEVGVLIFKTPETLITLNYSKCFTDDSKNYIYGENGYISFNSLLDIGEIRIEIYNHETITIDALNKPQDLYFEMSHFVHAISTLNKAIYYKNKKETLISYELIDRIKNKDIIKY